LFVERHTVPVELEGKTVRNIRKDVATEATLLIRGIPLDVVEVSEKHIHEYLKWNKWMKTTCGALNDNDLHTTPNAHTDINDKTCMQSTITFLLISIWLSNHVHGMIELFNIEYYQMNQDE
jgi:hypothetical protein